MVFTNWGFRDGPPPAGTMSGHCSVSPTFYCSLNSHPVGFTALLSASLEVANLFSPFSFARWAGLISTSTVKKRTTAGMIDAMRHKQRSTCGGKAKRQPLTDYGISLLSLWIPPALSNTHGLIIMSVEVETLSPNALCPLLIT